MVSNFYCDDDAVIPPPDDDNVFSSLSGIEDAVYGQPKPGGDGEGGGGNVYSGVSSGDYISIGDQMAGVANFCADNTWMGGSFATDDGGEWQQSWSLSDVSGAPPGGVFGKIRDSIIDSTASSTSGIDALIIAINDQDPGTHTSGVDTSGYQLTQLQQALVGNDGSGLSGIYFEQARTNEILAGNDGSGLSGIYFESQKINNNIIELQDIMASGVSATVGDVTIVGNTTDFATQTTLASILLDTADIETAVENIDSKVSTAALQTTINNTLTSGISELSKELYALDVSSTSGYDATVAQILSNSTEGLPGIVTSVERLLSNGNVASGLDGIYAKANSIDSKVATEAKQDDIISNQGNIYSRLGNILADTSEITDVKTNTALTQAGLSAVNIRASDGTSITETSNALDVFVKGGDAGGGAIPISIETAFGSESSLGVSSASNFPVSLETNNAGNLNMNIAAVGVGLGVFNSNTAGVGVKNGIGSILSVSAHSFASSVFIDEDANGDNPQTNTTIIAAPGAGNRIIIEGYGLTLVGSTAAAYGNMIITDGDADGAEATGKFNVVMAGRAQGVTPVYHGYSGMVPIGLAENAALKFSTTEGSGQMWIYGTIQFRIVAL